MKKALLYIWDLLRGHLLLKIMALLFAVILWSYVVAEVNPERERRVNDITVRYENMGDLKAKGLDLSASLSEILDSVDIRLEVKQSELKYINDETVRAYADLSTINSTGYFTLRVRAETSYGKVLEVIPSTMQLYVDDSVNHPLPVNVEVSGSVPSGYYADEPVITPSVITISGARVDVEKAASAVCYLDLSGLTEGYKKSIEVMLLDSDGNPLEKALFSESFPSVIVQLDILRRKTVPIDVGGSIFGQEDIAPGFEIIDITSTPDLIDIAGDPSVLAGISSINLVPYNVSGANTSVAVLLDYQLPEGVRVITPEKAQVFINIREIMNTLEFERVELTAKNVPGSLNVRLDTRFVDVTVLAGISRLTELSRDDIVPFVDLEGLGAGQHTLDVQFRLPPGFTAENFSPSVRTVTVTLY